MEASIKTTPTILLELTTRETKLICSFIGKFSINQVAHELNIDPKNIDAKIIEDLYFLLDKKLQNI